jgi:hypothetical protein
MTHDKIESELRKDKELLDLFLSLTSSCDKLESMLTLAGLFAYCDGKYFTLSKRLYENHMLVRFFMQYKDQQLETSSIFDKITERTTRTIASQASEDLQIAAYEIRRVTEDLVASLASV